MFSELIVMVIVILALGAWFGALGGLAAAIERSQRAKYGQTKDPED